MRLRNGSAIARLGCRGYSVRGTSTLAAALAAANRKSDFAPGTADERTPIMFKIIERLTDIVFNRLVGSQVNSEGKRDVPGRADDSADDDEQSHSLLLKVFAAVM